jgi:tetrahydrodipicolinate N-succinyltransferase
LRRYEECKSHIESFARGKALNEFVAKDLLKQVALSPFEECLLTWLRMQIEEEHGAIVKNIEKQDIPFCCNLHFELNGFRRHV